MDKKTPDRGSVGIQLLHSILLKLKSRGLREEVFLNNLNPGEIYVPLSVFCRKLGNFEAIIKYLKEDLNLSNKRISSFLARDTKTVWNIYERAKKKYKARFPPHNGTYFFPLSLLKDRRFGVLEILTSYLRDNLDLSYHEIATHLRRDDRTIWSTYQNYKQKVNQLESA